MKRIKTWLAVCAALTILCGMLPLSVWAADVHITTLTFLKVSIDEPVAGREADFDPGVGALPTNAARVYVEQKDNLNYHRGVGWRDVTDARYLQEGDCFIAGHEYELHVAVYVQNYFYQFSSSLEATVNGQAASVGHAYASKTVVSYSFGICKQPPADVTEVAIGGNLRPVAGQHPVFSLAFDLERMEIDPYAGSAFINGVAWYNSKTYAILDESDTFRAGETYTMLVQFKAKGNYRFATQNGTSTVVGTIEGEPAQNVSHQAAQTSDQTRYLKLRVDFTCEASDTLGGGADLIGVRIPYPVAGKRMSFEPTLYGEYCEICPVMSDGFYNGVKWTNRTYNYTYNNNAVFSAGSDYSVTVVVKAESIIQDDTRLRYIQHADGSISPYILAVVNGMPARVEPYKGDSVAQMVQVTFDFPACNDTSLTVDDVVFTDIRTPVIGETIDTVATVEYRYSENVPATRKTIDLTWLRIGDEGTELTATDVFEEGYEYAWVVALHTDAMSDFKVTDKRYSGNVSVRGALQTVTERCNDVPAEKGLMVGATYVPLTSLPAPIGRIDILGAIAPTAGEYPYYGGALAENQMPFAEITNVTWYENGNVMNASSAFKKGNDYRVTYTIETVGAHTFAQTAVIRASVNGSEQFYNGYEGSTGITVITSEQTATVSWRYGELGNASYTGVTDYVELSGLMLPAPGQIPDFDVDVDSAYTQFGGVTWYELDDNGYRMKALTPNDRFKKDTDYRAEICVLASAGRNLNIDSRGAYLNNAQARSYYLSDEAAIIYAQYNTADCISELDIINVQYPIGNKTPDTLAIPSIPGRAEGDLATMVAYGNGSDIDWYYETNPGTAVAGFSRLDGKFKTDRRHQAYVQVQTIDGAWFATDKDGNLVVNASIDGIPVDFSYTTDTYLSDGAVNKIEMARTYELAKNTDGVFVDGMLLTDGLYLDSNHWGIRTEDNVDKDAGYAYYENGVLTLCDFTWTTQGDYDAVASYKPLTVCARGKNLLSTDAVGINTSAAVTLTGDGSLELSASTYGVFTTGKLTIDSGTWYISADTYDGMWLYTDFVMNGGYLDVYGKTSGIYGDDWPTLTVNGGTLFAQANKDSAICWCDVQLANGANVMVTAYGEASETWDGKTDLADYASVHVTFEENGVLLGDVTGDGTLNMMDALVLYSAIDGSMTLTAEQQAVADFNSDSSVNMMDALLLYNEIAGS